MRQTVHHAEELEVLASGETPVERSVVGEHQTDPVPDRSRVVARVVPVDEHVPLVGCNSVDMIFSSVVLPAPLGPTSPTTSPLADLQVDTTQRDHLVIGRRPNDEAHQAPQTRVHHADPVHLEHRGPPISLVGGHDDAELFEFVEERPDVGRELLPRDTLELRDGARSVIASGGTPSIASQTSVPTGLRVISSLPSGSSRTARVPVTSQIT